jgi:hypothetical protein
MQAQRVVLVIGVVLGAGAPASAVAPPWQRTETRAPCSDFDPLRRPFFGDLHVHTSVSHDASLRLTRVEPRDAYVFAQGGSVVLPTETGEQTRSVGLERPLDFAAVTDHAEFFGEVRLCTTPGSPVYDEELCTFLQTLSDPATERIEYNRWSLPLAFNNPPPSHAFCDLAGVDCDAAAVSVWQDMQAAAEEAYDRSAQCAFTTFVGYENTAAPLGAHLHRNVIFRNANVPAFPASHLETGAGGAAQSLWTALERDCLDAGIGCEGLTIPHNSNLSGGLRWPDPTDAADARRRQRREPLVEIFQHKAGSECRFDRLAGVGVDTTDEFCAFEQDLRASQSPLPPPPIAAYPRRNLVRNVLKDGLALERQFGTNPFRLGVIGSTDTHAGTPGATDEEGWEGHRGMLDATDAGRIQHGQGDDQSVRFNPGGLAVVWAEENARDALYAGLARRETYGTSGTRPIVRFFGGPLDGVACGASDFVERAYTTGVPMGGELGPHRGGAPPRFAVLALKDPGTTGRPGTDLQRIQIVKGWVDAAGAVYERVLDIAGGSADGDWVDETTCEPTGSGAAELCTVWNDPDFDPALEAFYYVRILENPTCRWSTRACQAAGVDPFASDCAAQAALLGAPWDFCCLGPSTDAYFSPVVQERAWTSPIWYRPAGVSRLRGAVKFARRSGRDTVKVAVRLGRVPADFDPAATGLALRVGALWAAESPASAWRATKRGWKLVGDAPGLRRATVRVRGDGTVDVKVRSAALDLSAVPRERQDVTVVVEQGVYVAEHTRRWDVRRRALVPPRE